MTIFIIVVLLVTAFYLFKRSHSNRAKFIVCDYFHTGHVMIFTAEANPNILQELEIINSSEYIKKSHANAYFFKSYEDAMEYAKSTNKEVRLGKDMQEAGYIL
jgi:hypothetical protein